MPPRRLREINQRQDELAAELRELEAAEEAATEDNPLPEAHSERVAAITAEFDTLEEERAPLQADWEARERIRRVAENPRSREDGDGARGGAPNFNRNDDPFDLNSLRYAAPPSEVRGRARTAVERFESDLLTDEQRQELMRKVDGGRNGYGGRIHDHRGVIPGLVLHTGNPTYQRAFAKALGGASATWTEEERAAVARADEFRAYMGLTDGNGGYGVPVTLDPSLILTGGGSANPFRQIARVETITNDEWRGLASAGVTAGFAAEADEAGDNSPTVTGPTVTTQRAHAFVGASIEVAGDYIGLAADLQTMFAEAKDDLEATVFVSGAASSDEPIGITTALDGTASEIAPTTGETFALVDVFKLHGSLPPKYRSASARTAWIHELRTLNQIRQLAIDEAGGAQGILQDLTAGAPPMILDVPRYEASAMDSTMDINAGANADNFVLVLGDWRHYLVADRVGLTVEFLPHLLGANRRPTGERGWYAYWRVGADSINDNAFRMLSIPTAA